jgi:Cys-rich protein (TIGR01571 family)
MATTVFTTLYSENLFGCFDDFGICVYGYFCTPCLVGQSVEDAGQGKCFDIAYQISLCYLVPYCGPFLAMQRAGEAMNKVRSQPFATSRLLETFLNSSIAASLALRRLIELTLVGF